MPQVAAKGSTTKGGTTKGGAAKGRAQQDQARGRTAASAGKLAKPARPAAAPERAATGATQVARVAPSGSPRVSTAMADRLAERSAMRRHRTWRRVVVWTLVVALLVGATVATFWSPILALEADEVVVSGQGSTVDAVEVQKVVAAAGGTPLPRLDTVAMREEILGLHGVKDVRLERSWPHGVHVELTARVPVAAVPDAGRYVVLDAEGVRLSAGATVPAGLPEVEVPLDDAHALDAALHVLAALPPGMEKATRQVSAETQDAVTTVLADGTTVRWGSGADMPLKIETVRTLRTLEKEATTIDASSPELPVTR